MAKYVINGDTLEGLGNAIRSVTGSTKRYTPDEMIAEVADILNATTFILVDKDGNEYPAVYVDSDTVITATPNDIRKGTTAITADGVVEGEKEIPNYLAVEGSTKIEPGQSLIIPLFSELWDYTVFQGIICTYNTNMYDSVSAEKVVIDSVVYTVNSTEALATVTTDPTSQTINLGITNTSEAPNVIRYMIIKEDIT